VLHHHHVLELRQLGAHREQALEVELVLHQSDARLAVAGDVRDLFGRAGGVDADRHPARGHRRDVGDHPFLARETHDREVVARLEAKGRKPQCEFLHPPRVLAPAGGHPVAFALGPQSGAIAQRLGLRMQLMHH
jgi:hypothetical protein